MKIDNEGNIYFECDKSDCNTSNHARTNVAADAPVPYFVKSTSSTLNKVKGTGVFRVFKRKRFKQGKQTTKQEKKNEMRWRTIKSLIFFRVLRRYTDREWELAIVIRFPNWRGVVIKHLKFEQELATMERRDRRAGLRFNLTNEWQLAIASTAIGWRTPFFRRFCDAASRRFQQLRSLSQSPNQAPTVDALCCAFQMASLETLFSPYMLLYAALIERNNGVRNIDKYIDQLTTKYRRKG